MLLHPEILAATGAERDRSRLPVPADAARSSRRRPARKTGPRRRPAAGAAADPIRSALATALLGRRGTGTR
jgi:hypothetical protein